MEGKSEKSLLFWMLRLVFHQATSFFFCHAVSVSFLGIFFKITQRKIPKLFSLVIFFDTLIRELCNEILSEIFSLHRKISGRQMPGRPISNDLSRHSKAISSKMPPDVLPSFSRSLAYFKSLLSSRNFGLLLRIQNLVRQICQKKLASRIEFYRW